MYGKPSEVRAYGICQPYAGMIPETSGYIVDSSYISWPVRWITVFCRSRSGTSVLSAPDTSSRSSSTQRTRWDGVTWSRTTVDRVPRARRIGAGTGSLKAMYELRNQKWRGGG